MCAQLRAAARRHACPGSLLTLLYLSFVGMHLDVVPANPTAWTFDPFALSVDGDVLRGRGVTDCLGHVALLTRLLVALATAKPALKKTLHVVFIANEENSRVLGVGIDELVKRGELDALKRGPLYWVDVAESRPCIGTGGIAAWTLRASGKLGHSGMPHQSIKEEWEKVLATIATQRATTDHPDAHAFFDAIQAMASEQAELMTTKLAEPKKPPDQT